jgi:hypothetical protein
MVFVSNITDPRAPEAMLQPELVELAAWLDRHTIGRPQATDDFTVEELERMWMVGVYRAE